MTRTTIQLLAARDLDYVSLEQARSIDELVQALRGAARSAASWMPTSGWRCGSRRPDAGRGVGHLLTLLARNPPAGRPTADGT
jgi:hypothetical protein